MGYSDACAEADVATGCDGMELGQDPTRIRGQRGQDFTVTAEKQGGAKRSVFTPKKKNVTTNICVALGGDTK